MRYLSLLINQKTAECTFSLDITSMQDVSNFSDLMVYLPNEYIQRLTDLTQFFLLH